MRRTLLGALAAFLVAAWSAVAHGNRNRGTPPSSVSAAPDDPHLIRSWSISGTADGVPFEIKGILGYAPPPAADGPGRLGSALIMLAVTLLAAAAAFILYVPRRRASSSSRSA